MIGRTFIAVVLASSLACVVTTIGIYIISKYEEWGRRNTAYFMSFAAGVLVSVSFMHIVPESFKMNDRSPLFLLAGFLMLYLFNRFLNLYICHKYGCETATIGIIALVGIGFHSFLDGIIYSVTFNVSVFTGVLAATGMVLHEFPEGIVTFLLLERGGFSKRKAALYAFLAAAITTPLGTLVSYPLIDRIARPTLGLLSALSAGALVYVGASHLLPEVEKENRRYSVISLAAGVLVAVVIVMSKGWATTVLAAQEGEFREKGIVTRACVVHGLVVEAIINAAEREKADLIAIGSHGWTGLSRVFYGSVAAGVLHRVDRPLLLVRSGGSEWM